MSNPIIKSIADIERARLSFRETQAQSLATTREFIQKKAAEAREKTQKGVTVAQAEKAKAAQDQQKQAQQVETALTELMPQPIDVQTNQRGIDSSLATSTTRSTAGLQGIPGGGGIQRGGISPEMGMDLGSDPTAVAVRTPLGAPTSGNISRELVEHPPGSGNFVVRTTEKPGWFSGGRLNTQGIFTGFRPNVSDDEVTGLQAKRQMLADQAAAAAEKAEAIKTFVKTEGTSVGQDLYDIAKGNKDQKATTVLKGLVKQHGPEMGQQIFVEGLRQAQTLSFEERRAEVQKRLESTLSKEGQADLAREKAAIQAEKSTSKLSEKVAEIQLKIGQGQPITKGERDLLDERQRLSLEDRIMRNVVGAIGTGAAAPPAPEKPPAKQLDPTAFGQLQSEFGQPVTPDNASAFDKFLRDRGY